MPYKDPEKRRAANAERMRRRRAEGTAWIDPDKESERKARWYHEQGGKEKHDAAQRALRSGKRAQALKEFIKQTRKPS